MFMRSGRKARIGASIATAALLLVGSTGPASAATAQAAPLGPPGEIWINDNDQHTVTAHGYRTDGTTKTTVDCAKDDEPRIVRSWTLRERNRADFRRSLITCIGLSSDGRQNGPVETIGHFSYRGRGKTGISSATGDRLAVGVDLIGAGEPFSPALHGGPIEPHTGKLYDVAVWEADLNEILEPSRVAYPTPSALGRGGEVVTLRCKRGYVLTGVTVGVKHRAGGNNQAEIREATITCSRLIQNPELVLDRRAPSSIGRP